MQIAYWRESRNGKWHALTAQRSFAVVDGVFQSTRVHTRCNHRHGFPQRTFLSSEFHSDIALTPNPLAEGTRHGVNGLDLCGTCRRLEQR